MDLLGSILGSMEKPPSVGESERKKAREQKALFEKQQEKEKKLLEEFREKMQKRIHEFVKDPSLEKLKLETMDKVCRSIVHEVADIAGLASFSFGIEEEDRYVMLWKKEFAPTDEELLAYRRDEEWDPEKAKQIVQQRARLHYRRLPMFQEANKKAAPVSRVVVMIPPRYELERLQAQTVSPRQKGVAPQGNYKDKYKHLIGETAAKDAAQSTQTNRSYGFVSSENKRDHRTIEEVLAETRAKKKQKLDEANGQQSADNEPVSSQTGSSGIHSDKDRSVNSSEINNTLQSSSISKRDSSSSS